MFLQLHHYVIVRKRLWTFPWRNSHACLGKNRIICQVNSTIEGNTVRLSSNHARQWRKKTMPIAPFKRHRCSYRRRTMFRYERWLCATKCDWGSPTQQVMLCMCYTSNLSQAVTFLCQYGTDVLTEGGPCFMSSKINSNRACATGPSSPTRTKMVIWSFA